jgi:hypothetical protein
MHRVYNQAIVRKEAKEFDAAFRLYDEALAIRTAVYAQTSQVVGDTLYHMANARVLQGSRAGEKIDCHCLKLTSAFDAQSSFAAAAFSFVRQIDSHGMPPDAGKLYSRAAAVFLTAVGCVLSTAGIRTSPQRAGLIVMHCWTAGLSIERRAMLSNRHRNARSCAHWVMD